MLGAQTGCFFPSSRASQMPQYECIGVELLAVWMTPVGRLLAITCKCHLVGNVHSLAGDTASPWLS